MENKIKILEEEIKQLGGTGLQNLNKENRQFAISKGLAFNMMARRIK